MKSDPGFPGMDYGTMEVVAQHLSHLKRSLVSLKTNHSLVGAGQTSVSFRIPSRDLRVHPWWQHVF